MHRCAPRRRAGNVFQLLHVPLPIAGGSQNDLRQILFQNRDLEVVISFQGIMDGKKEAEFSWQSGDLNVKGSYSFDGDKIHLRGLDGSGTQRDWSLPISIEPMKITLESDSPFMAAPKREEFRKQSGAIDVLNQTLCGVPEFRETLHVQ